MAKHLVLLLSFLGSLGAVQSQDCDACAFDGNDEADCKAYGKIDETIVAWSTANEDCLSEYPNTISSIDPSPVCDTTNGFVNALRFGSLASSSVKLGLGVSEGNFFEDSATGAPALKDTITIDGTVYDCEDSESSCYNAMKDYFAVEPGATEKDQVCDTLYAKLALDRDTEQATIRIRLCEEINDGAGSALCEPLLTEVEDAMMDFPDKFCSGFGFGLGTDITSIPGCEDRVTPVDGLDNASSQQFSAASTFLAAAATAVIVAVLL